MELRVLTLGLLLCVLFGSALQATKGCCDTRSSACCQKNAPTQLSGFFRNNLLWSHGVEIIAVIGAIGLAALLLGSNLLLALTVGAFAFSLYFFRNPDRSCPSAGADSRVVVCPADGKVVEIVDISNDFIGSDAQRVSIFLSPLDVHVQWAPIAGRVAQIVYRPGDFLVAYAPKSSEINERNELYLVAHSGMKIVVRQIAGFIARRICCWVEEGQQIAQGTKYGMIRFGSRVDVIMPKTVQLQVSVGQMVLGGQTVLGSW